MLELNGLQGGKFEGSDKGLVLYTRRWPILIGLFLMQFLSGISFTSFGQISSFYVQFYHTNNEAVDWITNGRNIGAILLAIPLAWLIYKGFVGLRYLILFVSFLTTLGLIFISFSFCSRALISTIIIGQVFCGIAEFVAISIPSSFAALWFPDHQVGTAIAVTTAGLSMGDAVGFLVPPYLVFHNSWNESLGPLKPNELEKTRENLMIFYSTSTVFAAIVTIFFLVFVSDKPPTPATRAQASKLSNSIPADLGGTFWEYLKKILTNCSFVLVCLAIFLTFQLIMMENLMMAQVVANLSLWIDTSTRPEIVSAYVMSMFSIGNIFGSAIGGKLVNTYKKYKRAVLINIALMTLSSLSLVVGSVMQNLVAYFVGNFLFGFFISLAAVILYEMATQITFPIEETLVNIFVTTSSTTGGLVLGFIGRYIFQAFGGLGVAIAQSVCMALAFCALCFVTTGNKRLEAEAKAKSLDEHTLLLGKSEK